MHDSRDRQGPGIAADDQQRIFDRFVQLDASRRGARHRPRPADRALDRRSAPRHAGARAQRPGGTTFCVSLPTRHRVTVARHPLLDTRLDILPQRVERVDPRGAQRRDVAREQRDCGEHRDGDGRRDVRGGDAEQQRRDQPLQRERRDSPRRIPPPISFAPLPTTRRRMSRPPAPSARRMPISRVRCVTRYDITP